MTCISLKTPGVYICHVDGSCLGNPGGPMGQGVVIRKDGEMVCYKNRQLANPANSNNASEYLALILCLSKFKKKSGCKIRIYSDSKLVVNQMNGLEFIGSGRYVMYARQCEQLLQRVCENNEVRIEWIPREENRDADKLSNT